MSIKSDIPKFLSMGLFVLTLFLSCTQKTEETQNKSQLSNEVKSGSHEMEVMSFNIRINNPDDGENAWPNRKEFAISLIRSRADLVGLQEVQPGQLNDLDSLLNVTKKIQFNRVGISRDGFKDQGEFCPIYYRKDKYELIEDDTFWLSETPNKAGSKGWDSAYPRIVTWAKLKHHSSNKPVFIFNTHFDHRGEEAREESSELILKKIQEIAGENPIVLMGDFNADEEEIPYKILTQPNENGVELFDGFYNSKMGYEGPISTWNGFNEIAANRRIDFIFVNNHLEVVHHQFLTNTKNGRFPSDHLPVLATIKF